MPVVPPTVVFCRFGVALIVDMNMRLIGLMGLIVLMSPMAIVEAAALSGHAWSETIGWLSFGGPFYSASINDTSGNFSGYAWSERIGWIKLNPAGPYPELPFHRARLDLTSGKVTGWMRACAGAENANCTGDANPNADGWDGWIRMDGFENSVTQVGNSDSGCHLTGYAWGSSVVGWLKFSNANNYRVRVAPCLVEGGEEVIIPKDLSCTLSAFPRRLVSPQRTSRLTWSCVDADACSIAGLGPVNNVSGALTVTPPGTTNYVLNCNNNQGQSVNLSTTVTVIRSRICETIPYFPGCPR